MNVIDAKVTEVLSEPEYHEWKDRKSGQLYSCWTVEVKYADMGGGGKKELHFQSKEEAKKSKGRVCISTLKEMMSSG